MSFMVKKSFAIFYTFELFVAFVVNVFSVLTLPHQALHVLHGKLFFVALSVFICVHQCPIMVFNKTPHS